MSIKKFLALFLAIVMLLPVLAACNNEPKPVETKPGTTKPVETKPAETQPVETEPKPLYPIVDEPITIKGMIIGGTKNEEHPNTRKIWELLGEVTGINFEFEIVDTEVAPTRLAGGDWPDFIYSSNASLVQSLVADYGVVGGRFVDINNYLDIMPHLVKTYEDYPELKRGSTETSGAIYKLGSVSIAPTSTGVRPHVNMEVLRNAGINKKPETIDEFYQALVTLKQVNGEAGFIPWIGESRDSSYWQKMLFSSFGTLVGFDWEADDNDQVMFTRASEQMKRYWTFMAKLYAEGLINAESATMDTMVRYDLEQTSKKIAFIDTASGGMKAEHFNSGIIEMEVCIPFTSEYDNTRTIIKPNGAIPNYAIMVNADCKYIEELLKALDVAYAEDEVVEGTGLYGMAFCYGPEGVTWIANEDRTAYEFVAPEGFTPGASYANKEWIFGNFGRLDEMATMLPSDTSSNSGVRQVAYVNDVSPYFGKVDFPKNFLSFTEDEMYILENKLTDVDKYAKEMEVKFITGLANIETEWNTYIDNLNKMGLPEVLEVYQAAYNRFIGK